MTSAQKTLESDNPKPEASPEKKKEEYRVVRERKRNEQRALEKARKEEEERLRKEKEE